MSSLIDLLKAIDRRDLAAIRELANPDVIYDAGLLPIACKSGDVEVVRCLLEVANYRECYSQYAPEAFVAMRNGDLEMLRLLCEYGLDPDATEYSKHGLSITELAIAEKRVEYLRALLPLEPLIFVEYGDEETTEEEFDSERLPSTLELAARAGDVELASLLLEAGFPLGERSAADYLERAQQNAPTYQQGLKQQAREEQEEGERLIQKAQEGAKDAEAKNFWTCLFLILAVVAFCWLFWRLVMWAGWLGGAALLLLLVGGVVLWFRSF